MPSKPKCHVLPTVEGIPSLVSAFSEEEYSEGIATLKYNKAAGIDGVLVDQLKNLGLKAHKWLLTILSKYLTDNKIAKLWRQSKIIAILTPEKDSVTPKSYGPISLSCHSYKLYERMILNIVTPLLEQHLIKDQADFRHGKLCTSQLFNLTQHIEDDYLFNIYINDQPFYDGTRSFTYTDDLCVTAQYSLYIEVGKIIGDEHDKITQYYRSNSLRANLDKTQVTAFHLRKNDH